MGPPEEALGGGRAVGAADMEVMDSGEGSQLAVAEAMTAVVIARQVAVATFHAGAAALEQVGAALRDILDAGAKAGGEGLQRMGRLA